MWLALYRRLGILPITMLCVVAAMFMRVDAVSVEAKRGLLITGAAVQAEEKAKEAEKPKEEPKKEEHKTEDKKPEEKNSEAHKAETPAPEAEKDPLAMSENESRPSSELAILQNLSDRRRQIEAREAALMEKEALLKAGEAQFEAKIKELTALRNEIKALVDKAEAKEEAETKRLIAIYEKMKPKDAAGIMSTLPMEVLLPIAKGMKEAKLSPILAAMPPDKARQLTGNLSQSTKILPQDTPVRAAAEAAAAEALPPVPPPPAEAGH